MKGLTKNKKIFIIAYPICLGFSWLVFSLPALAAAYKLEFPLPGLTQVTDPGEYIRYFFIFGMGLVGFLAVAAIVVGGILYMTGSTVGKVDRAKQIIWGAITGLVLLLCSYALLYIIDPSLVNLSPLDLSKYNTNINQLGKPYQGATQCPSGQQYSTTYGLCLATCPTGQTNIPPRGCVSNPTGTATDCGNQATCKEALCAPGGSCYMTTWYTQNPLTGNICVCE